MDTLLQPAFDELRIGFNKFEVELRKAVEGVLVGQGISERLYVRLSICVLMIPLSEMQRGYDREESSSRMPMLEGGLGGGINIV